MIKTLIKKLKALRLYFVSNSFDVGKFIYGSSLTGDKLEAMMVTWKNKSDCIVDYLHNEIK